MQHRWRDRDDSHRGYRDHRPHDLDRRRPRSPLPTRRGEGGSDLNIDSKLVSNSDRTIPKPAKRGRSYYADTSKHRPHFSKPSGRRGRVEDEDRPARGGRGREFSPPRRQAARSGSIAPEHNKRYNQHERTQERGYKQRPHPASPTQRHRDRRYSPLPLRRERYTSPNNREHSQKDWHNRGDYNSASRRGRSRSPITLDHYCPETIRHPSISPETYSRWQGGPNHRDRDNRGESPQRTRVLSPAPGSYHEQSRSGTPDKPSKSSRRSEKQKQRTLRHLRLKNKTNDFLRSISPPRKGAYIEDRRMQQSTRPIQSILDEPSRQPSPPRPIPSFDDAGGSTDSQIREQFPLHGMKAADIHPSHRRVPTHIDTRQQYASSPQYMTPTSSHHASPPHSGSPYSQGRGGWGGQHYVNQSVYFYLPSKS